MPILCDVSEVGAVLLFGFGECLLGVALERDELAHKVLVYVHYGCIVVEISAIIFGAEYRHKLLVLPEEAVSILHYLVAAAYQVEVVNGKEVFQLFASKDFSASSLILCPLVDIFIRIVPQQVGY